MVFFWFLENLRENKKKNGKEKNEQKKITKFNIIFLFATLNQFYLFKLININVK